MLRFAWLELMWELLLGASMPLVILHPWTVSKTSAWWHRRLRIIRLRRQPTMMRRMHYSLTARYHFRNISGITFSTSEAANLECTHIRACGTDGTRKNTSNPI